jgi:hypothetical protein
MGIQVFFMACAVIVGALAAFFLELLIAKK